MEAISSDDVVKILIASDIHLGHVENDGVRGEDSFLAFEEVLETAAQCDVDMVLLAGDLFDHAKPTPRTMLRCTEAIRRHCLGDKPVALELLSDQIVNFGRQVNYEDPNLNVSYPIMSIHGNHDDPVGQSAVSSLDILSSMGLVNYFGKWNDYTHVRVTPVLFRKGDTRIALYGLGHLKDQRLSRLFKEGKVEMERPDDSDDWFNILALHQNRADRGPGNYISEDVLPNFLDLVVWGHEHDCRIHEEENFNRKFFVSQPGSTVATSLAAGEALPKHCAMLQICKKKFILTPIPLKTVRPFIFKTIVLSQEDLGEQMVNESEKVQEFLKQKVMEAIEEAKKLESGHPKQPLLPLVRLSVFFERDSQDFNRVRFCQNFNGMLANHEDILVMKRDKKIREKKESGQLDDVDLAQAAVEAADVDSLLQSYYEALPPERRLAVLSLRAMTDAVESCARKNNDEAFRNVLDAHRRRCVDYLLKSTAETEAEMDEQLQLAKLELDNADGDQLKKLLTITSPQKQLVVKLTPTVAKPTPAKRGRGRGAAAAPASVVVVSSDDDDEPLSASSGGTGGSGRRGRGGARARAAPPPRKSAPARAAPPQPERRTPRRSAAQKSASWLQNIITSRGSRDSDESD